MRINLESFGNLVMIKNDQGFTSVLIGMKKIMISYWK